MAAKKNKLVSFRVTPEFKSLLERAAENERRSQANLLEKLLFDHCHRQGISASSEGAPTSAQLDVAGA